ncbi:grasp-with-spasm system ATP-grasp peptide maturase [Fluviicola taffensis]|uniref:ATP-grasp fold domain protein, DUF201-type n=1 Tax=Fluviicola taffensis (strain DSM 16823 / NCIMB 13979 / RW262) TaxID=755732 RepID=F2I964_FLUTR|nr:grasp-with-spasm system ATP-grasp peptide maturase [Fluviicola taffensis]AEA43011.1 ATP-grasp fold domain protein, DUF201-type [Fluviicola taffensis DSM 16823]
MKVLLVFSVDHDWSTHRVLDWCYSFNIKPIIIDSSELDLFITSVTIDQDQNSFKIDYKNESISSDDLIGYWYRRSSPLEIEKWKFKDLTPEFFEFVVQELRYFNSGFFHLLKKIKGINNLNSAVMDKTKALLLAKEHGIKIPSTHYVTNSKRFAEILASGKTYITKPIYNMTKISTEDVNYLQYTELVDPNEVPNVEAIFPTLLQEQINKQLELRVFYLDEKIYPMAIFSQEAQQTSLDFRRYLSDRPNRTVPYYIDDNLKSKIIKLMNDLELNSGSLDFILSDEDELVFLEVNPVGQFGMVSGPCNYYLEKKIVEYFMN